MAKRNLNERLNEALEKLLMEREDIVTSTDTEVAPLLDLARDLRNLPRNKFREELKLKLQRSAIMSQSAVAEATAIIAPYLCCRDAARAIEFYKEVFGAVETMRLTEPNGRVGHAEIQIGRSAIMISDEYPEYGALSPSSIGGTPVTLHIYVDDVDEVVKKAIAAGAKLQRPVQDEFYGARSGPIFDPFGHRWLISTEREMLTADEITRRFDQLMKDQPAIAETPEPQPVAAQQATQLHTFAPYLHVAGADRMLSFLKRAFFAQEMDLTRTSDGKIRHAQVQIGEAVIEMGEAHGQFVPMPSAFHLYVSNADEVYRRAISAGAKSLYEPSEMPYGDREAGVVDPFGNHWYLGSRKEEVKTEAAPIPEGFNTVTPYLHSQRASELVEFTKRAFGGVETFRTGDNKTSFHAEVRIGNSMVMIGGFPGMPYPERTAAIYMYVPDVDAMYEQAIQAGGIPDVPPEDREYGDRVAHVKDSFGNIWYIATQKRSSR